MYYQIEVPVPANTTEADAIETVLGMVQGTIRKIHVGFPPGCLGQVHVQVRDRTWPLCPGTRGADIAWDDHVFELSHNYPLNEEPYEARVFAWNTDDTYAHTIFVGIELDPGEPSADLLWLQAAMQSGG